MREAVVVMAKAPRPGEVKTRLAASIGVEAASALAGAFLRDTLEVVSRAAAMRSSIECVVCFAPADARNEFDVDDSVHLIAQRGDSLDERLINCFDDLFAQGFEAIAVMNADSPTLPAEAIVEAFEALESGDIAIGPAVDGGYYLLAARITHPVLFRGVEWSTDRVLNQTLAKASAAGLAVRLLRPWYDVDSHADLDRLRTDVAGMADPPRATRSALEAYSKPDAEKDG